MKLPDFRLVQFSADKLSEHLYRSALSSKLGTKPIQRDPSRRSLGKAMTAFLRETKLRSMQGALLAFLFIVCGSGQGFAVIGGRSDHPERFPATVRFEGAMICTATIVGARAILTAGHCVDEKSAPDFAPGTVEYGGNKLLVFCTRHPQWNAVWNDVALCRLADAKESFSGVKYEVVQTDAAKISEDSSVVILGYGCVKGGGEGSKVLRWGVAGLRLGGKSKDPPSPTSPQLDDALMRVDGGAILCEGDSGSGTFDSDDPAKRSVIGIGIYGDPNGKVSRLVQPTDARIKDWLRAWGDKWGPICGVHAKAVGCR